MSDVAKKYLVFRVGDEEHAVPLLSVREVSSPRPTRPVPETPPYFIGVTNLRGSVISIISLPGKLGMESSVQNDAAQAVLVFNIGNTTIGVVVDEVISVRALSEDDIDEDGASALPIPKQYVIGIAKIEDRLVTLLDLPTLLNDDVVSASSSSSMVA